MNILEEVDRSPHIKGVELARRFHFKHLTSVTGADDAVTLHANLAVKILEIGTRNKTQSTLDNFVM
jgi:hypothetical protein